MGERVQKRIHRMRGRRSFVVPSVGQRTILKEQGTCLPCYLAQDHR